MLHCLSIKNFKGARKSGFWLLVYLMFIRVVVYFMLFRLGDDIMAEQVVKCVKRIFRSDKDGLTLDKNYEVVYEGKYSYIIIDDNNKVFPYDKENFEEVI